MCNKLPQLDEWSPQSAVFQTATSEHKSLMQTLRLCGLARTAARARLNVSRTSVFSASFRVPPTRRLNTPPRYRYSTLGTSFADPTRPDLYYHLVDPPTPLSSSLPAFALSFLPRAPPSSASSTVVGWLPAAVTESDGEAGLNDFRENPQFRILLHQAVQAALRDGVDDIQINGAAQVGNGWMHVHDDRNIPALGRIGDPDDIIASVLVQDGKILPETYQAMPAYRMCTSDGLTQLTPGLAQKLLVVLEERARSERSEST
ncbi:hypothetical protein B0H10DRAFT_2047783 [Mycena sp. CBHHK59/15]|nr:hypothetical protein B0H10DRAFT_2047783 [Mycena sp. CBHHK59/15]